MRNIHRPFWQELRDELSPRRNAEGWACVLLLLALFALVGELPEETLDEEERLDALVEEDFAEEEL